MNLDTLDAKILDAMFAQKLEALWVLARLNNQQFAGGILDRK
jgi:cytochrome c oxidase assembly factor CtaG